MEGDVDGTFTNCTFLNLLGGDTPDGAAIYSFDDTAGTHLNQVRIDQCSFDNVVPGGKGGSGAVSSYHGALEITNSTFNACGYLGDQGFTGGAVSITEGCLYMTNCYFTECTAGMGGAVSVNSYPIQGNCAGQTTASITNCTFTNNTAEFGSACLINDAAVEFWGTHFTNNTATVKNDSTSPAHPDGLYFGGAVSLSSPSTAATFSGCSLKNNIGGGIYSKMEGDENDPWLIDSSIVCGWTTATVAGFTGSGHHPKMDGTSSCTPSCATSADLNQDGVIDILDVMQVQEEAGLCAHDTDGDGETDINDLLKVIEGWGSFCSP
jgi:hypothetical protein